MNIKNLTKLQDLFRKSKKPVSELEYTRGNYDSCGNLIKEALPTITTNFCEIGLHDHEIYFVFVIESKTFDIKLLDSIKNRPNVKIYGFSNCNKTLFPVKNFNPEIFIKEIQKDRYLQVQFDFKDISTYDLFKEYSNLINIFERTKITVINQLEINLTKKN
jgi:hypothetical protein